MRKHDCAYIPDNCALSLASWAWCRVQATQACERSSGGTLVDIQPIQNSKNSAFIIKIRVFETDLGRKG